MIYIVKRKQYHKGGLKKRSWVMTRVWIRRGWELQLKTVGRFENEWNERIGEQIKEFGGLTESGWEGRLAVMKWLADKQKWSLWIKKLRTLFTPTALWERPRADDLAVFLSHSLTLSLSLSVSLCVCVCVCFEPTPAVYASSLLSLFGTFASLGRCSL